MQITRNAIESTPGPSEWFTGTVYIDAVAAPSGPSRLQAASVHFTPGARTAWHTHPKGQTIYVTEGVGLAQTRGGPIEVIRPGDRVVFQPGEEHWHGAAPTWPASGRAAPRPAPAPSSPRGGGGAGGRAPAGGGRRGPPPPPARPRGPPRGGGPPATGAPRPPPPATSSRDAWRTRPVA